MKAQETKIRYIRQIAVPEIGNEGQDKICDAKILIIGCGALGSMVAMQLAGAGIGTIGICDYDTIEISNLQRQFFFKTLEAGNYKADILKDRIAGLNPEIKVTVFREMITPQKAAIIFPEYDFIIDATDNPDSKKMTGKMSLLCGKACCVGGVRDFEGQVMTFLPEDPRFEEYFGEMFSEGFLPCSLSGVLGPAATFCASVQAMEAIKYVVGLGNALSGKIFLFDLLTNKFRVFSL